MIVLTGFYGEGNLGDEAILEGLFRTLPTTVPLAITSGREGLNGIGRRFGPTGPALLGNRVLQTLPRRGFDGFAAFLFALRHARAVVLSGGILQDWSVEGVSFWALRLFAARLFRCPAYLLGCGLGPLRSVPARIVTKKALQAVGEAWLRDAPSLELYQHLGGRNGRLGTDFSWAIPVPEADQKPISDAVGVNLRPWSDPWFAEKAHRDLQAQPKPFRLIVLHARGEDTRPWGAFRPASPDLMISEELMPTGFSDLVERCRWLREGWAMRYHVVLAMIRAAIPVRALCYDEKVAALAHAAGLLPHGGARISGPARRVSPDFAENQRRRLLDMQTACRELLG